MQQTTNLVPYTNQLIGGTIIVEQSVLNILSFITNSNIQNRYAKYGQNRYDRYGIDLINYKVEAT